MEKAEPGTSHAATFLLEEESMQHLDLDEEWESARVELDGDEGCGLTVWRQTVTHVDLWRRQEHQTQLPAGAERQRESEPASEWARERER